MAFNQMYNRYWKRLLAYSLNVVNDEALAEDILHDVFTGLWLKRKTLNISNLETYLFVSIRNKAISLFRRIQFTELDGHIIENLSLNPKIDEEINLGDLKSNIEQAANGLPNRCKAIFYMSRYHDYSNAEIASYFNISHRTVENQLSLALRHLRKTLDIVWGLITFLLL